MSVHVSTVEELVARVTARLHAENRLVVAVAGVPGAGKSTLVEHMHSALAQLGVTSSTLPQDGYHYYRHELARFADPQEAFRRRGAPYTFNAAKFVESVGKLRGGGPVVAPLFDHSTKDPQEGAIVIGPDVRVVFVEGNYVGLTDEPWCGLAAVVDELWVVETEATLLRQRLIRRHVESGVSATVEEATERADGLDWQNAVYVMEHTREPDVVVTLATATA